MPLRSHLALARAWRHASTCAALLVTVGGCSRHASSGVASLDEAPATSVLVEAQPSPTASVTASSLVEAPETPASKLIDESTEADAAAQDEAQGIGDGAQGAEVEVSEAHAVKVVALAKPTWIYEKPDHGSRRLGYVNPGMTLLRAERSVGTTDRCKGGWYKVAPRGHVCMNRELTTDLEHPVAVALSDGAKRGEPLPYRYGRTRGYAPFLYARVPTNREQYNAEGKDLTEHLEKVTKGSQLLVAGPIEPLPIWLQGAKVLTKPLNVQHRSRVGPHRGVSGPRSSFAFVHIYDVGNRLFGLTTDLDLIALDRVKLATESRFHGGVVEDLPAALVRKAAVPRFSRTEGGGLKNAGAYSAFDAISLTGETKDALFETRDGTWIAQSGTVLFKKRSSFPGFVVVKDDEPAPMKWIDISIREQTLTAYEGKRAVFVTRVSTGAGGDGDPETTTATIQGYFRIQHKHVTATMTGAQSEEDYELSDVPYVQYFHGGYALHAAFWHEDFGRPRSHGCVNLSPKDAAWLFEWTEPQVPTEWHGSEANGKGTLVYIH